MQTSMDSVWQAEVADTAQSPHLRMIIMMMNTLTNDDHDDDQNNEDDKTRQV